MCGDSVDVLATLEGLAGHSLVRREEGSTTRIAMLETLREFAVELLESSGEAESVRGRHAAWYLDLAERAELTGPQQVGWLRRLEDEHANLVAALAWLEQAGDGPRLLRFTSALWRYWRTNGYVEEARQWLTCGLSAPGTSPPIVRANALRHAANFARQQLDAVEAERLAAEALAVARTTQDAHTLAGALATAGNVSCWTGAPRARSHGLRRAAGRCDLGSLRARSRQRDDQPELARSARRRAAPRRTTRRRSSGSRIRAGRRRDGGGCALQSRVRAPGERRESAGRTRRSQTARDSVSTAAFASTSLTAWSASPPWRAWRRCARRGCASRRCRHDAGDDGRGARAVRAAAALTNDFGSEGGTRRGR